MGEGLAARGKLAFRLLRERVADARPEELLGAVENNRSVDEAVRRAALREVVVVKRAIAVTGAQLEATVGTERKGLSRMSAAVFTVSTARPPPTPKIMSAPFTFSFEVMRSTLAIVASLP